MAQLGQSLDERKGQMGAHIHHTQTPSHPPAHSCCGFLKSEGQLSYWILHTLICQIVSSFLAVIQPEVMWWCSHCIRSGVTKFTDWGCAPAMDYGIPVWVSLFPCWWWKWFFPLLAPTMVLPSWEAWNNGAVQFWTMTSRIVKQNKTFTCIN
jgi:hypothetical protein